MEVKKAIIYQMRDENKTLIDPIDITDQCEVHIDVDDDVYGEADSLFNEIIEEIIDDARRENVFIVQFDSGGIPDDPLLFLKEDDAKRKYMGIVGNIFKKNFDTYEQAEKYMSANWHKDGVRLYECGAE